MFLVRTRFTLYFSLRVSPRSLQVSSPAPLLRLFALRLAPGRVVITRVNGLEVRRHPGEQRTSNLLCSINNTSITVQQQQQHAVRGILSDALQHQAVRERGRRGGGFMGDLLDFHHPVVANLCPGWGRSRSCWKPPGPGTSPWWRNC